MKARSDDVNRELVAAGKIGRRVFLKASGGMAVALGSSLRVVPGFGEDQNKGTNGQGKLLFGFAGAQPPRIESLFPSDRWLSAISGAGYTHVFLQVDPFCHPESDRSQDDEDDLWLLSLFTMAAGPISWSYRAWLGAVSEAVQRHGLRLGMELWEPQLPKQAQQILPADWKGPAMGDGNEPLCVSQPAAREWLLENLKTVLTAAPEMDALAMGQGDNRAVLCDKSCPRCSQRALHERFGELYRDMAHTCRSVRDDFQFIPYDWWWPDEFYEATLKVLPKGTSVLTRLDKDAFYTPDPNHPEWSGHVFDMSLGCSQLGPVFTRAKNVATAYGGSALAMFTMSGIFEGGSLLPYVPAVGKVAQKFQLMRDANAKGWVDYDCGGIHEGLMLELVGVVQHHPDATLNEWLQLLAEQRYGAGCIETALAVWKSFDRAVEVYPLVLDFKSITEFSGRFDMGWLPMLPFIPERARVGRDLKDEYSWDDPHNLLTPEAVPPVRSLLRKALEFAQEGLRLSQLLTTQVPLRSASKAKFDEAMAELTVLTWSSAANFYSWAAALQGDQSVPLKDVIRNEIEVTQRYREFQIRPELEVGNMTWSWEREISHCVPQASYDAYVCSKLTNCAVPRNFPDAIGNLYAWKIAGLEKQLKAL